MTIKTIIITSVLIITFSILPSCKGKSSSKASPPRQQLIGVLDNKDGKYMDGCGCYFYSKDTGNEIYVGNFGAPAIVGWMNIKGEVEKFSESSDSLKKVINGVEHTVSYLKSGSSSLTIDTYVTGKDYEGFILEGIISIEKNSEVETINIKGGCGC